MRSMTGFGRGEATRDGRTVSIECKSVNNRYLDISVRTPRSLSFLEEALKNAVGRFTARGHMDVFVRYDNARGDAKTVRVDEGLLSAYAEALERVSRATGWKGDIPSELAARLPDVFTVQEAAEDEEALTRIAQDAVEAALSQLTGMRAREGERMKADILGRLVELEEAVDQAKVRAPAAIEAHRLALTERIREILGETPLDEARLLNEIAFFSDKAAVDEETARLFSHIAQMRELMEDEKPVGRQMDFLTQELNREVNTLCSKANDMEMTRIGLSMKNTVEKIREQVQNIE